MRSPELLNAIKTAHGTPAASAYWCGLQLSDASFGVQLEVDISSQLGDIEKSAKGANIPESAWRANLDAAKAATKKEPALDALAAGLEKHYSAA